MRQPLSKAGEFVAATPQEGTMTYLFWLIIVVITVYAVLLGVVSLIYWYEVLNCPCKAIHHPACTPLTVPLLFLYCCVSHMVVRPLFILLYLITRRSIHSPLSVERNLSRPPVVLVHGLYDLPASFFMTRRRLEKAGYRVIHFGYKSFFIPFETIVTQFDDFIYLGEASFPEQKFLMVGHSLGGLIIRKWLSREGNEDRVAGVVTLGTPHGGSKLAIFAPGKLASNLKRDSALICSLALSSPPKIPCTALASAADEMVLPAAALLPPDGWKFRETVPGTHLGLLFRKRVINHLIEELDSIE